MQDNLGMKFFIVWFVVVFTIVIIAVADILILEPTSLYNY